MTRKIVVIAVVAGALGALAFGTVNRTLANYDAGSSLYGGVGNGQSAVQVDIERASLLETLPLGTLNQVEVDALQFMLEEEKLARDVYTSLYTSWSLPVFNTITASEQTHMDAVEALLERYEITPLASTQTGVFANQDLQALYTQLIAQGSQSIEDALLVGGAIEEIDILDLQERIPQTDQEDIRTVFENLERGSYNHLNAFASNYSRQTGSDYQPQYLSTEAYQEILANAGGNAGGQGGRGRGRNGGQGRP
ncbi:MAG: hypothetical protein CVU39_00805 [Chloroflexi bacterium HGW-Chloroflexi-10]|nr:MAG: hypothetical protein CVU39_00805 [Chloroflexi bacterium HGW-Chloroflexi-10]